MTQGVNGNSKRRLIELDALRGVAATLVMLYHLTTRYEQLYGHESPPSFSLPWGHYGVNLFFMISGFVIFMTLHRISRPLDFVVSRFSRLFPAFWVAVILTFLLSHALQLPGKMTTIGTAAVNLFMIHGLFRIPHVDGVYWTLQVEIIFYCMALSLYMLGRLDKVHSPLLALLVLQLTYFLAYRLAGIEMSWTLSHLLILPFIAWFVCGIMIYRMAVTPEETPRKDAIVLFAAIAQLGVVEGLGIALLAASLSLALWLAVKGKLPILANAVFAWLGAISYTLYLLHENIGWGVILHAERMGLSGNLSILLAIVLVLTMATGLTWLVERPSMNWLRQRYRQRAVPLMNLAQSTVLTGVLLMTIAGSALAWYKSHPLPEKPGELVDKILQPSEVAAVPCQFLAQPKPLMIFVLGQSNAGNHGETIAVPADTSPAVFFHKGSCYGVKGAAPGATGRQGNLWVTLAPELARVAGRPVIFSTLSVEGTEVRDWVEPGKLRDRLIDAIADQQQHGFVPELVLWQQGEADTRAGTTRVKYVERFRELVAILRNRGISATIVVALSTRCHNDGSESVREALKIVAATDQSIELGPDTDELTGTMRLDDCHFSIKGQRAAGELWIAALAKLRRDDSGVWRFDQK